MESSWQPKALSGGRKRSNGERGMELGLGFGVRKEAGSGTGERGHRWRTGVGAWHWERASGRAVYIALRLQP